MIVKENLTTFSIFLFYSTFTFAFLLLQAIMLVMIIAKVHKLTISCLIFTFTVLVIQSAIHIPLL